MLGTPSSTGFGARNTTEARWPRDTGVVDRSLSDYMASRALNTAQAAVVGTALTLGAPPPKPQAHADSGGSPPAHRGRDRPLTGRAVRPETQR